MLYEKLLEADYNEKSLYFTPIQAKLIFYYWGTPEAYKAKHAKISMNVFLSVFSISA